MKDYFSPGSLITVAGGALTVVGAIAYTTGSANLSLPTIFYGIPIFLGGIGIEILRASPSSQDHPNGSPSQPTGGRRSRTRKIGE